MFSQLPGVRSAGVGAEYVGSAQDKFKVRLYHGVRRILQKEKTFNTYIITINVENSKMLLLSKLMLASKDRMQG